MKILSIKQLKYMDLTNKKIIVLSENAEKLKNNKNILLIKCADTTRKSAAAFSEDQAKKIMDFIKNVNINNILVACDCGISRSAAVGAAILRKYKQDKKIWNDPKFTPNILIYDTLCRAQKIKNSKLKLKYLQYINKKALKKAIERGRKKWA